MPAIRASFVSRARLGLLLASAGVGAGCEDHGPIAPEIVTCASSPARVVRDTLSGILSPGRGPHVLEGTVRVGTLHIEAGTLVCGGAGALLSVQDTLIVSGTAERPVVLTAL